MLVADRVSADPTQYGVLTCCSLKLAALSRLADVSVLRYVYYLTLNVSYVL